jgi:threonine aldolase
VGETRTRRRHRANGLAVEPAEPDRFDCPDAIAGHGRPDPAAIFAAPGVFGEPRADVDLYGAGVRLNAFEARIAKLLGKDAAVFMPSGTMAQQIALRIVADRDGLRTFAAHPTNHLTLHERDGITRLHGLHLVPLASAVTPIALTDLQQLAEPIATLLIELPQRELGGVLPEWDDLVALTNYARERNWHVHLDGARLWEAGPFYRRKYARIAALFDSVYVSFYKGIGAIAGAMLCGSQPLIDEARIWQRRHGGNLMALYPYATVAEQSFDARLGRMGAYRDAARWLAELVAAQPGTLRVQPVPPPTNMFHAYVRVPAETLRERVLTIAREQGVWTILRTAPTAIDGITKWEISTGDAALALGPERARTVLELLLAAP